MATLAPEFTPELTESFLKGRLDDIGKQESIQEGQATSEAASRGLAGQAYEASLVGSARAGAASERDRAIGAFNYDVANLNRQERLTKEERDYSTTESQKERDFQSSMAEKGYAAQRAAARQEHIWGQQGYVTGELTPFAENIGSSILGGLF